MITAYSSLLRSSIKQLPLAASPLQRWIRSSSTPHKSKLEPVTIDYNSLNKTTQTAMQALKNWERACIGSALATFGGSAGIMAVSPLDLLLPVSIAAIGMTSFQIFAMIINVQSKNLEHEVMTSLSSLSIDTATQQKITQLMMNAPYLSATASSSEITIAPVVTEICSSQIVIPVHMVLLKNKLLKEIVAEAKTPEEAINKLVAPKHLKGNRNSLIEWAKTPDMTITRDERGNLLANKSGRPWIKSLKTGNFEGVLKIPHKRT